MTQSGAEYLSLEFPCYVELKCAMDKHLQKIDGAYLLSERVPIGKMILNLLSGKRERTTHKRIKHDYPEKVVFAVSESVMMSVGSSITSTALRDINLVVKESVRLELYRYLQLSIMADPNFHIHNGIVSWMQLMGIPEDGKTLDNYKRNFTNWRLMNCPELIRPIGRPRK